MVSIIQHVMQRNIPLVRYMMTERYSFRKGPVKDLVVRYFIRADIPGSYTAMPPSVSLMYFPDINGSGADNFLTVEK